MQPIGANDSLASVASSVLVVDGTKWDLSNLMTESTCSELPCLDSTVGSSSAGVGHDYDDEISTLGGSYGGTTNVSLSSQQPSQKTSKTLPITVFYPSVSEIPACLDVEGIFTKLKEARMIKRGRLANQRPRNHSQPQLGRRARSKAIFSSSRQRAPGSGAMYSRTGISRHQRELSMPVRPQHSGDERYGNPDLPAEAIDFEEERRNLDIYYKKRQQLLDMQQKRRIAHENEMLRREREEEEMLRIHQVRQRRSAQRPIRSDFTFSNPSRPSMRPKNQPCSTYNSTGEGSLLIEATSGEDGLDETQQGYTTTPPTTSSAQDWEPQDYNATDGTSPPRRCYSAPSQERAFKSSFGFPSNIKEEEAEQTLVEVTPGNFVPLIGSRDTWSAIQEGRVAHTTCFSCMARLVCIDIADMVICPDCEGISPVSDENGQLSGGGGLGLGMKEEEEEEEEEEDVNDARIRSITVTESTPHHPC